MIRQINHDISILSKKSSDATIMDLAVAKDLEDTLAANADGCVGMAANMIGVLKNIIVFDNNGTYTTMLNPKITYSKGEYEAMEGCLSLPGQRKAKRFQEICVSYQDKSFAHHEETFTGFVAQIIQHEIDHLNGILI